jgi:radical SAM superfamily enzyme
VLGDWFQQGEFTIISLEDYVARVGEFLSYLHPSVVIQRLVGRGPRERLLFSNWGASWWLVKQRIEEYLDDNDIYQGMKCDYLNGKALRSHGYA